MAQTTSTKNKRPRGRTPGWTPGLTRVLTHAQGEWAWDHTRLLSKLVKSDDPNECWQWLGSVSPAANLFGAYKNGKPQMTQVNRLLAAAEFGEDMTDRVVYMRCGNYHCSNPQHFHIQDRLGPRTLNNV